ncbi:ABC transporter permease [Neorhizobium sp. P12A]|nr:ABC transporter permease [Neorhizobium sp. P12A]
MTSYVLRRVIAIVALAFGISVVVFMIIRLIPGDPVITLLGTNASDPTVVERLRTQLGLDKPLIVQYWLWISNVFQGDFGYSYGYQQSVSSLLADNFPATIQLTIAGLGLSVIFGLIFGVIAALRRNRAADTAVMGIALTFMSIPSFWLGLLLILAFAVTIPWFDVVGGTSLKGLVLPSITLALGSIGFNARFVRSSIIAAQVQRHVITARAKGLTRLRVFFAISFATHCCRS